MLVNKEGDSLDSKLPYNSDEETQSLKNVVITDEPRLKQV